MKQSSRHLPFTFKNILVEAISYENLVIARSRSNQEFLIAEIDSRIFSSRLSSDAKHRKTQQEALFEKFHL